MIEIVDVHKRLAGQPVLRGVNLTVKDGEILALVGPSGCGKSVLLRHVIGLLVPDRGDVRINGRSISRAKYHDLPEFRRYMGYVFQDSALLDSLTVRENLRMALDDAACTHDPELAPKRIRETLALVNLTEDVLDKLPGDLSGGMRKRVGVARAVINEPRVILYDEPTTGLDPHNATSIIQIIVRARVQLNATSMVVTHAVASLPGVADRVALLTGGRIAFEGTPGEFLNSEDPRVLAFLGEALPPQVEEVKQPWRTTRAAIAS
jgi:phospholipid/cholesterol/gamma-HCH transport system ATP-binding protein